MYNCFMNNKKMLYKYKNVSIRGIQEILDSSVGYISKYRNEGASNTKVDNAVIFAAGVGNRLRPLTLQTPKPLLEVDGTPMIETTIKYLLKNDIRDIYIVVGYLKEKFNYLLKKYPNLKLIENDKYRENNNISSLMSISEFLGNTLIIEGGINWNNDVFPNKLDRSTMFSHKASNDNPKWSFIKNGKYITNSKKGSNENSSQWLGYYFLAEGDSKKIQDFFKNGYKDNEHGGLYAEQLLWLLKIKMDEVKLNSKSFYKIDTLSDYEKFNGGYSHILNDPLSAITYYMKCHPEKVSEIKPIKGGLTNNTYSFKVNDQKYIIRITREETNKNIDRINENKILNKIKNFNISAENVVFSEKNGIAIFKYIDKSVNFRKSNEEIINFAKKLKTLHSLKGVEEIKGFDLEKRINNFIHAGTKNNIPMDGKLLSVKDKVLNMYKEYKKEIVLCHNDLLGGNLLWNGEEIKIIDWEYSTLNDKYWDVASWITENEIDEKQLKLFEKYYGEIDPIKLNVFKKCNSYYWTMWCYLQEDWSEDLKEYFEFHKSEVLRD